MTLLAKSLEELTDWVKDQGQPAYRGKQLHQWLYEKGAHSLADISVFPQEWRSKLADYPIGRSLIHYRSVAPDRTRKYLLKLADGLIIEAVGIPSEKRLTVCVSSQVGCAMACSFCNTGDMGLMRNLKTHEIVDQILEVAREYPPEIVAKFGERITNIVYMGMGEPMHNLQNVLDSIDILTHPHGFNISHRKITVSTSGLVPQMLELGKRSKVNLAVSLNATTDELRDQIMPVNRRYNLQALLDGCRQYELGPGRRITFEYVLLKGLNDSKNDAQRIIKLLAGIPAKVNLIPFNPHPASPYKRPELPEVMAFQKYLLDRNVMTTIRISKGPDILAACGQLRSKEALRSKHNERRERENRASL
jgi:23S rRNA (adenine2503-C2)-methyltransferase